MRKVRVMGPRERLEDVLEALQDAGLLHLSRPYAEGPLHSLRRTPRAEREARHLRSVLIDLERTLDRLPRAPAPPTPRAGAFDVSDYARWARLAHDLRREVEALDEERDELEEERAGIRRFDQYYSAFERLVPSGFEWTRGRAYYLILRATAESDLERLRDALGQVIGGGFELLTERVEGGGLALVLLVPKESSEAVERILREVGVDELPLPAGYGGRPLGEAIPRMRERVEEIDERLERIRGRRRAISEEHATELSRAQAAVRDRLLELEALDKAMETERAFVLEGWVPAPARERLVDRLESRFGDDVVIETIAVEEWEGEEAPVELTNPRLFRPFEAITRMMPLPRYGSIDPTPFVGVFFPMFFGVILGDVAYGLALAGIAALLHVKSRPETMLRSVAEIAGACAAFSIAFGFVYGELLGDVGRHYLGMRAVFDREEALFPFLVFTVALGFVHVLLGLVLGSVTAFRRHHPRESVGKGVSALMIVLITVALLAAAEVLPGSFFTPAVIGVLVAFPVLVIAEGVLGPVELLSTFGNILSYARIMALGTASVVMAVVANEMVGAVGSVVVGVLFGLIFHLVNLVLGVFGPTIHAIRLHYVEFFGKFYSPGGTRYQPFGHWRPEPEETKPRRDAA